jgi:hypothetical protein
VNSAKRSGDGFLTLPCSECRTPIYDVDKYFDIVLNGKDIELQADRITRIKHSVVGMMILFVAFIAYSFWVTKAMQYSLSFPMALPHVSHFVTMVLIIVGIPYLFIKKVLTFFTTTV